MKLYRFQTYRTTYYFPQSVEGGDFLYGLYHPYNRYPLRLLVVKVFWWLFRHCNLFRHRYRVEDPDRVFPYSKIMAFMPSGSIVSFNLGTPGPEQKISMLGVDSAGNPFFAKYSTKDAAKALSRNEIMVLQKLNGKNLAPVLLESCDTGDAVFFRTTCVDGKNPNNVRMNDAILDLVLKINNNEVKKSTLTTSLSHGDFTPWNLLLENGDYRMIDWEMAGERELGYDLFTYITQVGAKLNPEISLMFAIEENKKYIDRYFHSFDIEEWGSYLKAFAKRKIAYEVEKGDTNYASKFECLL